MRTKRKREKYYLVLSKRKNYKHGAFPHTEEGKRLAEEFIKKDNTGEELYIVEK